MPFLKRSSPHCHMRALDFQFRTFDDRRRAGILSAPTAAVVAGARLSYLLLCL